MIAFVENRIDPAKAMINPAIGMVVLLFFGNIIKQTSPKAGLVLLQFKNFKYVFVPDNFPKSLVYFFFRKRFKQY